MKRNFFKLIVLRIRRNVRNFNLTTVLIWAAAGLGFLTLAVAVWSIEKADWINPEPSLITTLSLALALAFVCAYVRLHGAIASMIVAIGGIAVTIWQTVGLFQPTTDATSFQLWWQTVTGGSPSEGTLYFSIFLILITWIIGFLSLWFLIRKRNPWLLVGFGSVMLLVNLGNLPHENYYFFPLFFLVAGVTVAVTHLAKAGKDLLRWTEPGTRRGIAFFAVSVFSVSFIVSGISFFIPEPPISNIGLKIDTSTFNRVDVEDLWFNIFADVRSKWTTMKSKAQERLQFKDPLETGTKVHFLINSPRSDYWRVRRYDVYESWGWSSTVESGDTKRSSEPITYEQIPPDTRITVYTVENRLKTDVILASGEISSTDVPITLQTFYSPLPVQDQITADGKVRDLAAIVSSQVQGPYQRYRVMAITSVATPEELTVAGTSYPTWVTDRYLQLPANFPSRLRRLAAEINNDARTPYEKAIAVKNYLRKFHYNEAAPAPPEKTDGVDYFINTSENGVCTNFASAMAVLLRASGVPTRLASGYFRGEHDEGSGMWVIQGRNYHAWVEVYFPTYGWIEFEATPAGPVPGTDSGITDTGYNFTFAPEDELPFWMMDDPIGPTGPGLLPGSSEPPRRSLPWPYIYLITIGSLAAIAVLITREILDRWVRRIQHVVTVSEAYERMCLLAYRAHTGPFLHETPREFSNRLLKYLPGQEDTINIVTQTFLGARYSQRKSLEERDKIRMQKAWVELVPSLVKHALRLRKWTLVRLFWKP